MRRQLSQLALVALALAGCGAPPAPEGFTLAVQMMNVRPVAVDALRITFTPRDATPPVVFQPTPPQSYEDGAITVEVDGSGILSMVVTGDYVRAHSTMTGVDAHRFEVEIWSDDDAMRDGPQIRGTVLRMGESIAQGAAFLPGWPVPLGATSQVTVTCSNAALCLP